MKVELFILQMKMLKQYQDSRKEIEQRIDDLCYQYMGVRGVRYDKQPTSTNEAALMELRLKLSEALVEPERELDFTIYAINQLKPLVYGNLNRLPDDVKKACELVFFENKTYYEAGKIMGYSDNGLWQRIRREVKKL